MACVVRNGDNRSIGANHGVDIQPRLDQAQATTMTKDVTQPAMGRLIEYETLGTLAAPWGAAGLKQIQHKGWDSALLEAALCVSGAGVRHGSSP